MKFNGTLSLINLSLSNFIFDIIQQNSFVELNIRSYYLNGDIYERIFKLMKDNTSLRSLILKSAKILESNLKSFDSFILNNAALKSLYTTRKINTYIYSGLLNSIAKSKTLKIVNITLFEGSGLMDSLDNLLKTNKSIEELTIQHYYFTDTDLSKIAKSLTFNTTLNKIIVGSLIDKYDPFNVYYDNRLKVNYISLSNFF